MRATYLVSVMRGAYLVSVMRGAYLAKARDFTFYFLPCLRAPLFHVHRCTCGSDPNSTPMQMGAKGDVSICRSGPNEASISGDLIVDGVSLAGLMERFDKLEKMMRAKGSKSG